MTKVQAIKHHIELRDQFWEIKRNPLHYACEFVRYMLHSQETIESASQDLQRWIADYGTVSKLKLKLKQKI